MSILDTVFGGAASGLGAAASRASGFGFGPPNRIAGTKGGWAESLRGPAGYSLASSMRGGFQQTGLAGMWSPIKNYFGIGYQSGRSAALQATQGDYLRTLVGGERAWSAARGATAARANFAATLGTGAPEFRGAAREYHQAFSGLKPGSTFRRRQITGAAGIGLGAIGIGATVGWGNVASVGAYGLAGGAAGAMLGGIAGRAFGRVGSGGGMGKVGLYGGAAYGAFRAMGVF